MNRIYVPGDVSAFHVSPGLLYTEMTDYNLDVQPEDSFDFMNKVCME